MPDDRRPRHLRLADDVADAARVLDVVRPGSRPPGVPHTVTEPDLGAQAAAGLRALFAHFTLGAPLITTGTDDSIVDVDLSVRLTAREVERLLELATSLAPIGR